MEKEKTGATERIPVQQILEWFNIKPHFKNLKTTDNGEIIYGTNLIIPIEDKKHIYASPYTFNNLASAINILQHLRTMGENVPMNIWFVSCGKQELNETVPNDVIQFKSYFYKDIINQGVTSVDEIITILTNGPYDIDDGKVYKFWGEDYIGNDTYFSAACKMKNGRFFKITVDNDCWERWYQRYITAVKSKNPDEFVSIFTFAEELKHPEYLKDYIEPVKTIPTKMASRMNTSSKVLSYVISGDTTQPVMDSPRVKNMKYLCSKSGEELIEKYLNEYGTHIITKEESTIKQETKENRKQEVDNEKYFAILLLKSCSLKSFSSIMYARAYSSISPLYNILNNEKDGKLGTGLPNIHKIAVFEFDTIDAAENAVEKFEEWKKEYMVENCCLSQLIINSLINGFKKFCVNGTLKYLSEDYSNNKMEKPKFPLTTTWTEKITFGPDKENIRHCIAMALSDVDEKRFKDYKTTLKECLDWIEENKDAQTVPPLTLKHDITSKD